MSAGKGDKYRPVNAAQYSENFDRIDWRKTCYHCKGKGMVHVYEPDVDDVRWDDCPVCDGDGKIKTNKGE